LGTTVSVTQKIRHEGGDHTFRNIVLFLLVATLAVFFMDLHKEIHKEKLELEIKRKRCHDEYMEN
jgi:hypothetical protein